VCEDGLDAGLCRRFTILQPLGVLLLFAQMVYCGVHSGRYQAVSLLQLAANLLQIMWGAFVIWDAASVGADIDGYDMCVRMAGVEMAIDKGRLVAEIDFAEKFPGKLAHFAVFQLLAGMVIQGEMDRVGVAALVERRQVAEPVQLIIQGQFRVFLPIIEGTEEYGFFFGELLLVIKNSGAGIAGALDDRDHIGIFVKTQKCILEGKFPLDYHESGKSFRE